MNLIFKVVLFVTISSHAYAGDNGGGSLECRSTSGRTILSATGVAEYNGTGELSVTLTVDGKSLQLGVGQKNTGSAAKPASITVFKPDLKVYTAGIVFLQKYEDSVNSFEYTTKVLELVANPSTFKSGAGDKFSFDATLNGIDPRKENGNGVQFLDNPVTVKCKMDQGI